VAVSFFLPTPEERRSATSGHGENDAIMKLCGKLKCGENHAEWIRSSRSSHPGGHSECAFLIRPAKPQNSTSKNLLTTAHRERHTVTKLKQPHRERKREKERKRERERERESAGLSNRTDSRMDAKKKKKREKSRSHPPGGKEQVEREPSLFPKPHLQ